MDNNSEKKCPYGFDNPKHAIASSFNNSNWWPNQLNLKILHQNSSLTNPMGEKFDYPKEFKGNPIGPARGLSLKPIIEGKQRDGHKELYYRFSNKYTALLMGDWKLVDKKELYNLKEDMIESNDLAKKHPEKFQDMLKRFNELDVEYNKNAKKKTPKKKKKKDK